MRKTGLLMLCGWLGLVVASAYAVPDFTFIQVSDLHAPSETSKTVVKTIASLGSMELTPYGVKSKVPAFIIATGDLTEFGEEGWNAYQDIWQGIPIPHYDVLGNHDVTWSAVRNKIREKYGAPYYSIDTFGCHFIFLESAITQDPMPGFGMEEILWLKEDLKKIKSDTPVFVSFHHPLDSNEFVNPSEKQMLLEIFQPYNVICMFVGHGHSARYHNFDGFDGIQGGSSSKGNPGQGYNIITISNNSVFIAYRLYTDATTIKPLLQKSLKRSWDPPNVLISSPGEYKVIKEDSFEIKSIVYKFTGQVARAQYQIDGGDFNPLTNAGSYYGATIPTDKLDNGVHYLRVLYTNSRMTVYKIQRFVIEHPEGSAAKWRAFLTGSAKANPVVDRNNVYIGTDDGMFACLDKSNGRVRWTYPTGGEIITTPTVSLGVIYFGSGDGNLYALNLDGSLKWKYRADSPIYSSPLVFGDMIYFGSKLGSLYALEAQDGKPKWKNTSAGYAIESKPAYSRGIVYFTAWDGYVYAVVSETGKLLWKNYSQGPFIRPVAKKYYSAADANPQISAGDSLIVTDRDWYLTSMALSDGTISWATTNSVSACLGEDGKSIYLRTLKGEGHLQKWSLDGKLLWTAPVKLNDMESGRSLRYTIAPVEKKGKVYAVSCWGTLYCVNAETGKLLWNYQLTPKLAVMSTPAVDDNGVVYISAMDGTLTAVDGK